MNKPVEFMNPHDEPVCIRSSSVIAVVPSLSYPKCQFVMFSPTGGITVQGDYNTVMEKLFPSR